MFTRGKHPLIEIKAHKNDSYQAFVNKAARKCGVQAKTGKSLYLFKLNGARMERQWTVGNYLAMLRKGAASVKMGVGYIAVPDNGANGMLPDSGGNDMSVSIVEVCVHSYCSMKIDA